MTYYTIPTLVGLAELAAAQAANETVPFTHIALGDGGGVPVFPTEDQAGLVNQVYLAPISNIKRHATEPTWVVFEAAVPEEVGGWDVRETALIGGRVPGKVMALGNYPLVEKTVMGNGASRAVLIHMIVAYANAAQVDLYVDPQAFITLESLLQAIADHEAKADPHPQYLTKSEADAFYDSIGLAAAAIDQDVARLSAHVADPDPHPQYLTPAEMNAQLLAGRAKRFFHTSF